MQIRISQPAPAPARGHIADELPKAEEIAFRSLLADTSHNIYFTPAVAGILEKRGLVTVPQTYNSPAPVLLYPMVASTSDKGFLNTNGKLALDIVDIVTVSKVADIWAPYVPGAAPLMPGVNILVGAVGCYDKFSRPGFGKRLAGGFCLADLTVKILLALSNFIPALQNFTYYFIGVQVIVKIGDKVAEVQFRGSEEKGRVVLQDVQFCTPPAGSMVLSATTFADWQAKQNQTGAIAPPQPPAAS